MKNSKDLVPVELIERKIFLIRAQKVMLDRDLAELYEVSTKALNQAVKRNADRFPYDFAFQLTSKEAATFLKSQMAISNEKDMRSQIVTASKRNIRFRPYAFTEHGAMMAANILRSPQAAKMSVYVVRAFVRLRQMLSTHTDLARRLEELEQKYDSQFKIVFDAIRALMAEPEQTKRKIGFVAKEQRTGYAAKQKSN
jgi:hypothetical protein